MRREVPLLAAAMLASCEAAAPGADWERMLEQPRYDAYEAGPGFPDGRVLQHPPEGTVPRDRVLRSPLATGRTEQGYAGEIPVRTTPELLASGKKNFDIYCAACHGPGGYGGSMVAMNMQPPLPASLRIGHGAEHSPGYYFEVITRGRGRMPSYAAELSVMERWAVVAYLTRVLQRPHPLTEQERVDSLRAEVLRRRFPEEARRNAAPHTEADEAGNTHGERQGDEHGTHSH